MTEGREPDAARADEGGPEEEGGGGGGEATAARACRSSAKARY